jgi:type IV secretion system protein VirB8
MMPLKTVVPYTLLVDRNTGYVQALEGVPAGHQRRQRAAPGHAGAICDRARGYDAATISDQYRKVSLWSANGARAEYLAQMQAGNAASPINRHGRAQRWRCGWKASRRWAMRAGRTGARWCVLSPRCRMRAAMAGAAGQAAYWVAVLQYRFVGNPASLEDRLTNPLGFQVVAYRRDQEAPPVAAPVAAARSPLLPR